MPVAEVVFLPVHCDTCRNTWSHVAAAVVAPLVEHGELPCPTPDCAGVQVYVGEAGLAEAVNAS